MENLLQLLLEAPITRKYAQDMIKRGQIVSVFYNRKWIKIEPVKIINQNGIDYFIAFQEGEPDKLYGYEFSKLTNWNVLGIKPAKRAAEEILKFKKDRNRKVEFETPPGSETVIAGKSRVRGSGDDPIEDAVLNKRVCRMYYQGDKENEPGWRTEMMPVCLGSKGNVKYLRAWVGGGKSVSGEKNTAKALPGWRFFRVDRIKNFEPVGTKTFSKPPRADYNKDGDKLMDTIIAQSKFDMQESRMINAIMEAVRIL